MASEKVLAITDDSFENDVLKSDKPVLVDFWADWCGPCRMVGPIIDDIANDYDEKVMVGKVNVDENKTLVTKYRVMSIPTIILFKDGEIVETTMGAHDKAFFENMINKHI